MVVAYRVREEWAARIPAVVHVADGTTRPQLVRGEDQPEYHAVISAFHRLTGVPLVLNTSFNDKNNNWSARRPSGPPLLQLRRRRPGARRHRGAEEGSVTTEKRRSHREIGRDHDLFMISPDVGRGLVAWLPQGILRHTLEGFWREVHHAMATRS